MKHEIELRIMLDAPPTGVLFGVQQGKGSIYQITQKQLSNGGMLVFDCTITAIATEESIDFKGEVVQGKRGERFIYISIGSMAGQLNATWSRRLKIPLTGISMEMMEANQKNKKVALQTTVAGTAKDGGPNCATPKPFMGWQAMGS
ncbi:MAG: DUF5990 family protein [Chitinophagaceae bacterium]|nr:DUF5990 family protein [Chitinophagaceae bacterium]